MFASLDQRNDRPVSQVLAPTKVDEGELSASSELFYGKVAHFYVPIHLDPSQIRTLLH